MMQFPSEIFIMFKQSFLYNDVKHILLSVSSMASLAMRVRLWMLLSTSLSIIPSMEVTILPLNCKYVSYWMMFDIFYYNII